MVDHRGGLGDLLCVERSNIGFKRNACRLFWVHWRYDVIDVFDAGCPIMRSMMCWVWSFGSVRVLR